LVAATKGGTAMSAGTASVMFRRLFDDASLFPPASLAMADAVPGHLRHRTAWYQEMSGPFVCADSRLTQLSAAMTSAGVVELDVAVVLPGGADSLSAATDAVFADPRLRLRAVEVPVADPTADGIESLAAALDATPLAGATAFMEIPIAHLDADALHITADHRYQVKLRTGGTTAEAFPDEATLARALMALAWERQPFKCTAGLHHAVRHLDTETGFEHHGFLNVMLAVAAALDGASAAQVEGELADNRAEAVAERVAGLDAEQVAAMRGLFTSFGTCSTDEPVTDLVTLGLVSKE
jgi:hypothetical protein